MEYYLLNSVQILNSVHVVPTVKRGVYVGKRKANTKKEETRKAILDASVAICLEDGFEELSIRKITDRLGYSSGIVYHYFEDKQEILDTIH